MRINQLAVISALSSGDQIPVWVTDQGDTFRASMSTLLSFIQQNLTLLNPYLTQYSAPSATDFSVTINGGVNDAESVWLVLTPTGAFADGTIVLPEAEGSTHHGQEIVVNCTRSVTTLVIDGNGATVTGAPTTLAANAFFRLRFDGVTNTWYRIG